VWPARCRGDGSRARKALTEKSLKRSKARMDRVPEGRREVHLFSGLEELRGEEKGGEHVDKEQTREYKAIEDRSLRLTTRHQRKN